MYFDLLMRLCTLTLGKDTSPFSYTNNSKPSDSVFQAGDRVRVTVDKNELKRLQTVHHGGWNPRMNQVIYLLKYSFLFFNLILH